MFKKSFVFLVLLLIIIIVLPGCKAAAVTVTATTTAPAPPPLTVTINKTSSPLTVTVNKTVTATVTITPTPTTPVFSAIPTDALTLTDPTSDLVTLSGAPVTSDSFLDITGVSLWSDSSDYIIRLTLNGDLPLTDNPDTQTYYEWGIWIDTDQNASTGTNYAFINPALGAEYIAYFALQGVLYAASVDDLVTNKSETINYTVYKNTIEFHWPKAFHASDSFNFVVVSAKYGERQSMVSIQAGDKVPSATVAQFP